MIDRHKFDLASSMDDKALSYIGLVNDHQQFPAARVAYGRREVRPFTYTSAHPCQLQNE